MVNKLPTTELEQSAFCQEDALITKPLIEELKIPVNWQEVPQEYLHLAPEIISDRIFTAKRKLSTAVTILGHHYQREEVIQFADTIGDSYLLSVQASKQQAKYIIFCGVQFMAETADIVCQDWQKVILPNLAAGCSMADMAPTEQVQDAWLEILTNVGSWFDVIPVAYMNSTAEIKSLCGRNKGIICTSSNVTKAFKWALDRGNKIFFLPDQHLGKNTAKKWDIPDNEIIIWDPYKPLGGNTLEDLTRATVILWKAHCSVHTRFTTKQIESARQKFPKVKVIVHPECTSEVVDMADMNGSTEMIINRVNNSKSGSIFAIGTEINLVNRLAKNNPDKTIFCLDSIVCPCSTMYRIHPAYLLWVLESIIYKDPVNVIEVSEETKFYAKRAINRMMVL